MCVVLNATTTNELVGVIALTDLDNCSRRLMMRRPSIDELTSTRKANREPVASTPKKDAPGPPPPEPRRRRPIEDP